MAARDEVTHSRGIPALVSELAGRIRRQGPLSFAEFMTAALYHPVHGYYTCGRSARAADFRTSPQVHPVFGDLLARQAAEMHRRLGSPRRFRCVELGPGDGALAVALLPGLAGLAGGWEYHLIEASPALREEQKRNLAALPEPLRGRVRWSTAEDLAAEPCDAVVVSNEFFDALPVHRIRGVEGTLREVRVGWEPTRGFHDVLAPVPPELARYLDRYGAPVPDGTEAEVGLEAIVWVDRVASMMRRGYVITVDYGDEAPSLFGAFRPSGTLLGYYRHRTTTDLLHRVGEQDLTAHVNFTALVRRGEECGLQSAPVRTQTELLLALGILERMDSIDRSATSEVGRWRARFTLKELFAPGGQGERFRVLVQASGAPLEGLTGLAAPWRHGQFLDRGFAEP